jgi:hypothetical protein
MHAAWNSIVVAFFDASTKSTNAELWIGEGGVLVTLSVAVITALFLRLRRRPTHAAQGSAASALGTLRL